MRKLLLASLACLPLASAAQTVAGSAAPHYYVGLAASVLSYAPASSYSSLSHVGPSLTAGVQFAPSWALQVGAALSWRRDAAAQSYSPYPGQLPTVYEYDNHITTLVIPVLARYTLEPQARRFHGDVLGGITVLHAALHSTSSSTAAGQTPYKVDERYSVTRASVALGLAARYAILPQVELTADGLANFTVTNEFYKVTDRLFLHLLVGVRYNFGQR